VLYDRPANIFVAGFIGSPAMNLMEATLLNDALTVKIGSQEFTLSSEVLQMRPGLKRFAGRSLVIGIRPEDLSVSSGDVSKASITGEVELVEALGSELLIHFQADAPMVRAEGGLVVKETDTGDPSGEDEEAAFVARVAPRHKASAGDRIQFDFPVERLEFFNFDTGDAIYD
jgi:multiple sugar transport system ATP-binding protein